jgi:hypothetical protein
VVGLGERYGAMWAEDGGLGQLGGSHEEKGESGGAEPHTGFQPMGQERKENDCPISIFWIQMNSIQIQMSSKRI